MKKINLELLNKMINEGMIVSQKHPTLDIYLYNYTRKCTYEKCWNEVTLPARGLILDGQGNIVSLPMGKFFNYEELSPENRIIKTQGKRYKIYSKVDGSCGILWKYAGEYGIATRGSFNSDQAIWATAKLHDKYGDIMQLLNTDDYTFVFEIIYPKNQIVVNYGKFEDIVMLAVVDKRSGIDLLLTDNEIETYRSYGFNFVDGHADLIDLSFEELKALNWENKEGFVLHFEDGFRMKLKFADYCRLHSIITNITFRDIWDTVRQNKPLDEILENVPDEFDAWVRKKIENLNNSYRELENEIKKRHAAVLAELPANYSKKWFAMKNKSINNERFFKGAVFAYESGKDLSESIWKKLYPPHEKPYNIDIDE